MKDACSGRKAENVSGAAMSVEEIVSEEYYLRDGRAPEKILDGVSLCVNAGEAWGISACSAYEVRLLLEVMASKKPCSAGKCLIAGKAADRSSNGMRQLVYIDCPVMPYGNLNTLEYLMLAREKQKKGKLELQSEIFESLIAAGLGYLSLSRLRHLGRQETAIVLLMAACWSDCSIIVCNLSESEFDSALIDAAAHIADAARKDGKALVFGTNDSLFVEKVCSHAAFLKAGKLMYRGTVKQLRMVYDKTDIIITDADNDKIMNRMTPMPSGSTMRIKEGRLFIGCGGDLELIYRKILSCGIMPQMVMINPKTVQNAYEELCAGA